MTEVKFNLGVGNLEFSSDEDLQKELAKSGGKYFDTPGNMDLKITAADFHKNKKTGEIWCEGDNTWFNVVITLKGSEDKEIQHWIQVPTTKLKYGKKDTLAVFKKLQEFLFGIGEEVTMASFGKLCEKYFSDPSKLIGTAVNVDLGYEGPYVERAPDSENFRVIVGGKPLMEDGTPIEMPDRASAVTFAKGRNITPSFIRVLKFTPSKKRKASKASDWTDEKPAVALAPAPAAETEADEVVAEPKAKAKRGPKPKAKAEPEEKTQAEKAAANDDW